MFGEFENVRLSAEEHIKLLTRFGPTVTKDYIERASAWLKNTRKRRSSHYAMILSWLRKDRTLEYWAEPKSVEPLLEDADLMWRAEIMQQMRQRQLEFWELDMANHRHDLKCQFGAVCAFVEEKRPKVPTLDELIETLKVTA